MGEGLGFDATTAGLTMGGASSSVSDPELAEGGGGGALTLGLGEALGRAAIFRGVVFLGVTALKSSELLESESSDEDPSPGVCW